MSLVAREGFAEPSFYGSTKTEALSYCSLKIIDDLPFAVGRVRTGHHTWQAT